MTNVKNVNKLRGFSLLELSVVLVIIGLVTAMGMSSGVEMLAASREKATRQKMLAIDQALLSYRIANNRLPCPASLTIAEGTTNFGVEGATPGTCTGGTPAANYSAAGATNTSKTGVEGAVPVATLGLPNDMMYDGWGRRIRYVVDKALTANTGFSSVGSTCTELSITIKDGSGSNRTTGAAYALISHGAGGHGGYTRQGVITSEASTNADEQTNCHCDASAVATTYAPTYVQKDATINSASATDTFDDIVTYKERWQVTSEWERPQGGGTIAFVQATTTETGTDFDSDTVSFSTTPTAGNSIIVGVQCWHSSGNLVAGNVTDNQGNTYSLVGDAIVSQNGAYLFAATNISSSGTFTLTLNPSGTSGHWCRWGGMELTGAITLDQSGEDTRMGPITSITATTASTTSQANEFAVAILGLDFSSGETVGDPDTAGGWTERFRYTATDPTGGAMSTVTKSLTATGTVSHTWSNLLNSSSNTRNSALMLTFTGGACGG